MDAIAGPVEVVLVAVDGTDESLEAAAYAVTVAGGYDASVHALYVLDTETTRALDRGTIDPEEIADDGLDRLARIEDRADAAGVELSISAARGFSRDQKGRHPGTVVLDTAEGVDADFIVVPRESSREGAVDALEKAARYVLSYASQPVLSV